tara:strand:+ start:303 stop:500 length:198 start_codon:yes stop_codon:yes gene_type:complete
MNKSIKLEIGQMVSWKTGMNKKVSMTGAVINELENGKVHIMTHTQDGRRCHLEVQAEKEILTLIK